MLKRNRLLDKFRCRSGNEGYVTQISKRTVIFDKVGIVIKVVLALMVLSIVFLLFFEGRIPFSHFYTQLVFKKEFNG